MGQNGMDTQACFKLSYELREKMRLVFPETGQFSQFLRKCCVALYEEYRKNGGFDDGTGKLITEIARRDERRRIALLNNEVETEELIIPCSCEEEN